MALSCIRISSILGMYFISLYCKLFATKALHYCFACFFSLFCKLMYMCVAICDWLRYFFKLSVKRNKEKRILMQKESCRKKVAVMVSVLSTLWSYCVKEHLILEVPFGWVTIKIYIIKSQGYFNRSCERP